MDSSKSSESAVASGNSASPSRAPIQIDYKILMFSLAAMAITRFLEMKKSLQNRSEWFMKTFGIAPDFKSGLHIGRITTGEIGMIKKDIICSGDILNATARIQSLCKTYKVDNIISGDLKHKLEQSGSYCFSELGINQLRGKNQTIDLFTIKKIK